MFKKREYKVSIGEDWAEPEETLLDSASAHSDLEQPITPGAFRFVFVSSIIASLLLLGLAFNIGIVSHRGYESLAYQNRSVNFSIPPPRGIIFDRTGKPLVRNIPSFDLLVVAKDLSFEDREGIKRVSDILSIPPDDFLVSLKDQSRERSVFFVALDIPKDKVLDLSLMNIPGFHVISTTKRQYIDGSKFSQVIGYVGKVGKEDLNDPYYTITDSIGKLGIEIQYERYLRGEHGRILFENDQQADTDPVSGENLVLTIDADLQAKLYEELYTTLREAGLSRGAGIIQNPNTGEVLALVSFPTFDNNLFISGLSDEAFKKLFDNPARPLFNRVVSGLYNPGSTIKPLIALMALADDIIDADDTITDCISLTIPNPLTGEAAYVFKNWREEYGQFNLRKAIANSCNIYFFTVGGGFGKVAGLGINAISKYLESTLANAILGIDIPGEKAGLIPNPAWKEGSKGEPWYLGDTYNVSIGQGDLLVTPLWLNTYIGGIASKGKIYRPYIGARVVDNDKNVIQAFSPNVISSLPFDPSALEEVKKGMEQTVESGTAQMLKTMPIKVAAKTGTAEVLKGKTTNSLFTAFAPSDNPEISMTILIEGITSNQGLAVRVANNVLRWYYKAPDHILTQSPEATTVLNSPTP
ncbi:MAG TPA: penicillin-binding protein 2 [Candidatus Paceibacterota bacterium]